MRYDMSYYKILFVLLAFVFVTYTSYSDQRSYVWTYEYMIMEPGRAEIEQYTTFSTANVDDYANNVMTDLNVELEVGMNPHYDFAVYQNFKQSADGSIKYDGFKLRTRIKIGEKDQFFMDPLIYIEYIGKANMSKHAFEPKLILAKDFGKFNISINPYCEIEQEGSSDWQLHWKYAVGVNYKLFPLLTLGIESKGDEYAKYLGPTIGHGTQHIWCAFGVLHGIGNIKERSPKFLARLLLGVHL